MDRNRIVGDWSLGFREVTIVDQGNDLILTCPDAPSGFEGRLVEVADDRVRIEGGPLHGAELILHGDAPYLGGQRAMTRLNRPARAESGSGLTTPAIELQPEEEEAFEGLWNWVAHPSRAPEVDPGGLDLCRFVRWLTDRDLVLFHGASRVDLDQLLPASWPTVQVGTADETEIVYANDNGLCAMFLALVETGRDAHHRVERFHSLAGDEVDIYHFSVPRSALEGEPFHPGGLYLVPRERFRPVPLYPEGPLSGEWLSPEPVRPLACLIVTPNDFPLRQSVGSYD